MVLINVEIYWFQDFNKYKVWLNKDNKNNFKAHLISPDIKVLLTSAFYMKPCFKQFIHFKILFVIKMF